jgi:hypothetical protein
MKCLRLFLVTLVFFLATAATSSALVNGDIDNDGVVTLDDALLVLRYVAGTPVCWGGIYPYERVYPINRFINCSEIEYSCMAIQNEFNQNIPYCFITGAVLIRNQSTGHI